ncbi:adhesion G protein-coupled receptor E1 isoform X2 [Equus asinus]|uniref:adhesion G protein-coupled receptor E1 isoform X2 n=1 Tax=Equus asinus TaxID=9793 RepID=UPI0038F66ECD
MWSFSLLLFWGCCRIYSCETPTSSPLGSKSWREKLNLKGTAFETNECVDTTICPAYATCTDTSKSYYCSCKKGFLSSNGLAQFQGSGVECKDIDECSKRPTPCGAHSVCKNLPGRYKCSCLPGFSSPTGNNWNPAKPGRFSCTDINECLSSGVCPEHSECTNSLGSYSCTCLAGFSSRNSICEDVDECADPKSCPEHATCHNSPGSYSCVCNQGFVSSSGNVRFQGQGETCADIDECSKKPSPCGANSVCKNLPGKYKCSCLPGFSSPTGNDWNPAKPGRFSCTDINECLSSGVCPEHSECTNSLGSYSCSCRAGFSSRNSICEDVDECADPKSCPEHATCHNSPGSYSCVCNQGFVSSSGNVRFQGQGETCADIDECSKKPSPCGANSVCKNLPGKYKCSCLPGFSSPTGNDWNPAKPGRFSCTDINECLSSGVCPEHSECTNSLGSYSCSCRAGFSSSNSICEDVDECADPRSCPEHATCHNSLGSYSCVCNKGFVSSSGNVRFQGQGETCEDVDECSKKPSPCGANSVCKNLPGRYKCSCLPGFSSPTGNDWNPAKPGRFSCTDINECLSSGICPEHSECTNSLGSYSCSCLAGFSSRNSICEDVDECADPKSCPEHATCHNSPGSYSCVCNQGLVSRSGNVRFQGQGETCEDIDECLNKPCLSNARCTNTPGSYFCTCHPGFAPGNGQLNSTDQETECRDIDECLQDPSPCGPNSICTNALGSYSCSCIVGFHPNPEGSWIYGNFSCERAPFKCKEDVLARNKQVHLCQTKTAVEPEDVAFCTQLNAVLSMLDDACENTSAVVSLKDMAENISSVLEQTSTSSNLTREATSTLAVVLLESVKRTTLAAFLNPSGNVSQTIRTEHLDVNSRVIKNECSEGNMAFSLKAKGDKMTISCSTIKESGSTEISGVAFVSFAGMESLLNESFFRDSQTPVANSKRKLKINSRVIGGMLTGKKKDGFSEAVNYTLEHLEPKKKTESPMCVSWTTDEEGGRWVPSGCEIIEVSETHTVCRCKRMANLAIIMASGELTMEFSLFIISHVGMIISLVCLVLAIATFLLCRGIRSQTTSLHLHLCVCLFLAKLLFLTGVDKTDNETVCAIIAGFLHYLFLACFSWMLVEAVVLFLTVRNLKVVNYFSSRNIKMLYLCVVGYGLPGVVVAVLASVQPQGYGTPDRCWLKTETKFIWSFLGPVCGIIVINSILLTLTLWILKQKLSTVNADVSTLKDNRLLTFKAFAQLFILGCSWVLGIFQIGPMAGIMAYLFTIINSLQGAFIFIIHCLLNHQVREAYRRCFTRKAKSSSQVSQTSGIFLSSMSSNSKTERDCVVYG